MGRFHGLVAWSPAGRRRLEYIRLAFDVSTCDFGLMACRIRDSGATVSSYFLEPAYTPCTPRALHPSGLHEGGTQEGCYSRDNPAPGDLARNLLILLPRGTRRFVCWNRS